MSDPGASTDGAQQLGGVSHRGTAVTEGGGELRGLTVVALLVLGRRVGNTCEQMDQQYDWFYCI